MRCALNIRFSIPSTHLVVYATFYTKGKNWEDEYKMRPRRLKGPVKDRTLSRACVF